ncbi:UPF0057-domain-containing protein [Jaminaea rosea]|uniref:UPF0057-domain-containing protein n=1 Tax=Jaminaea rosea TaxID=1569628 RepID=A0A316V310_9BASI|nr:UPF0057-domain-containing protein [Jaminaea rosea]PWN30573.1 UPF0057-domain-containing protein [Jaminaea rosea]
MAKATSSNSDVLLYFLSIFVPPAPVGIKKGCGADILINICLCFLGWLPAVIHALWIVSKNPDMPVQRY